MTMVYRNHVKISAFFLNFGFAKATIYLVPIIVATIASEKVYGSLEIAWSISLLSASITIGIPISGINQRFIVRKEKIFYDEVYILLLICSAISFCGAVFSYIIGDSYAYVLVWAAFGSASLHTAVVTIFRMIGKPNLSAWSDGTAMLCAVMIILFCIVFSIKLSVDALAIGYTIISLIGVSFSTFYLLKFKRPALFSRLRLSSHIGFPMVVAGLMAIWLGVGGRLTVGAISPAHIAVYSIAFRFVGLGLGIHQLATTLFYVRLYKSKAREADRIFSFFYAFALLFLGVMGLLGYVIISKLKFNALPDDDLFNLTLIFPVVSVQIFFWIGFAMLQMRINRYGLAMRSILPLLIITVVGAGLIFGIGLLMRPGIIWTSWGLALHAAAYFAAAYFILAKRGLPHVRIGTIGLAGGIALAGIAVVKQMFV